MEFIIVCIIGALLLVWGIGIEHPYNIGRRSVKSNLHEVAIGAEVFGVVLMFISFIGGIDTILHL